MKIAYSHLLKKINSNPRIEELSDKLFQLGHEHEIDGNILNMEFTPNRGDCLSVNGILRDLAVFYDVDLNNEIYEGELKALQLNFTNNAKNECPHISFLKIEIEGEPAPYSGALLDYFSDLKLNSNNLFTDISNFISYETGQPTHCYDFSKINDDLVLDKIDHIHEFETLLGKKIKLTDTNLVFLKGKEIINLAGIIGSKSTACSKQTRTVLVECAYFNPEEILGKSTRYDIQSDAAHKFERGVNHESHESVLRRLIKIVADHSKIRSIELFSENYKEFKKTSIPLDVDSVNKIIGISISEKQYKNYLLKLGFIILDQEVLVPAHRNDIKTQNDLAEEIARVVGYDNIERKEISLPTVLQKNKSLTEKGVKTFLVNHGFYEVINAPFVPDSSDISIKVDNPLDSNREFLRTNLKNSLINNLLYNERRQKDSIKLFEISDLYVFNPELKKDKVLGIIASGREGRSYVNFSKKINNDYLRELFQDLLPEKILNFELIPRNTLNTKIKNEIFYLELSLHDISHNALKYKATPKSFDDFVKYQPISEFPSSFRDISFSVSDPLQFKTLEKLLLNYKHNLLKEVFIFDYYNNEKLNEIKIGFRFIFQSKDETITDINISKILDDIVNLTLALESIKIPGLTR